MLNRTQNPFLFSFNPFSPPALPSVQKTELQEGGMKMEDFLVNYNSQNDATCDDFFVDDLLIDGGDEFFFETGTGDENASEAEDKNPQTPPLYTSPKTEELKPTGFCTGYDFYAVPADDVADLEWLSNFVEDSFSGYSCQFAGKKVEPVKTPVRTSVVATPAVQTKAIITKRVRTINKRKKRVNPSANSVSHVPRRCTHCGVQKTPQWRAGPHGAKTLCNACGVRFKSGRLFPEYRPACSPTFSSEMHSNNHRKVLEMRVKKLGELSG